MGLFCPRYCHALEYSIVAPLNIVLSRPRRREDQNTPLLRATAHTLLSFTNDTLQVNVFATSAKMSYLCTRLRKKNKENGWIFSRRHTKGDYSPTH